MGVRKQRQLIYVPVGYDDLPILNNMKPRTRAVFTALSYRFRNNLKYWLKRQGDIIPQPVFKLLFESTYDTFFTDFVLRTGFFATILCWFYTNNAPMHVRQHFWLLFFEKPIFHNGLARVDEPYVHLFNSFNGVSINALIQLGAFHKIGDLSPTATVLSQPKWVVYNVWGCRGVFFTTGGTHRKIDPVLKVVDVFHNTNGDVTETTFVDSGWDDYLHKETIRNE